MDNPKIFSIQHFCIHDGPGIRSTVFFKGCPLRCVWCQNPESWKKEMEIAFRAHRCLSCGQCAEACPQGLKLPENRPSEACSLCLACVQACPAEALIAMGEACTEADILARLRPEYPNFEATGGGVTFSGGEAGMFPGFLSGLAASLKKEGVHLAMETCGMFDSKNPDTKTLLQHLDLLLFDVKIFDTDLHKRLCGTGNYPIKANLREAAEAMNSGKGPLVWPRLPLVPDITDGEENLSEWAEFLSDLGFREITLLPFHDHGNSKRLWLSEMPKSLPVIRTPDAEDLLRAGSIFEKYGMKAHEALE